MNKFPRRELLLSDSSNRDVNSLLEFLDESYSFLDLVSYLHSGRVFFMTHNGKVIQPLPILLSASNTLDSIYYCVKMFNMSDAFILLRRYRDDLFFYLYLEVAKRKKLMSDPLSTSKTDQDDIIDSWLNGSMKNVDFFKHILSFIATEPELKNVLIKYDLQQKFRDMGDHLNDYVHANSALHYNRSINHLNKEEIRKITDEFKNIINEANITFVILIYLVNPILVMADDHLDYLEEGMEPPPNSQYQIAPFIKEYIERNSKLLGDDVVNFLIKNSIMDFDGEKY